MPPRRRVSKLSSAGLAFVRGFGRGDSRREAVAVAVLLDASAAVRSNRELADLAGVSTSTVRRWRSTLSDALARARTCDGLTRREFVGD